MGSGVPLAHADLQERHSGNCWVTVYRYQGCHLICRPTGWPNGGLKGVYRSAIAYKEIHNLWEELSLEETEDAHEWWGVRMGSGRWTGGGGELTGVGIMLESAGSNGGADRSAARSINVHQALRVYIATQGAWCTVTCTCSASVLCLLMEQVAGSQCVEFARTAERRSIHCILNDVCGVTGTSVHGEWFIALLDNPVFW